MTALPSAPDAPLEFRFRWDAAEHRRLYAAVRHVVVGRRAFGRIWRAVAAACLVACVVLVIAYDRAPWPLARALAPWLALLAAWVAFFRFAVPALGARVYRRAHAACIPHDQVRVVSAEGVAARCTTSDMLVRWAGIRGAVETDEFFLFLMPARGAIQIPRRAVPPAALPALRAAVVAALGDRAELRVDRTP